MMVPSSPPPRPNEIDGATIEALRSSLSAYLKNPSDPSSLRAPLNGLAREARAKNILAEQVLRVLKGVWNEIPAVQAARDHTEHTRALQQIVTMLVREYYSPEAER